MTLSNRLVPILFVESYPQFLMGQQRTLLSLLERSRGCGVEPMVAVPLGEGPLVEEVRKRGVEIVSYPYPKSLRRYGGAIYKDRGLGRTRVYMQAARYIWSLRKPLKDLQPQAVFCNDMRGLLTVGLAARTLGLPVVTWDKLDKPHGWLDTLQLPIVTRNPVISRAVTRKYPRWQRRLYDDKIAIIPNGADLELFRDGDDARVELQTGDEDVLIGIIGTITWRKGQDRVLKVFDRLVSDFPYVKLVIVGETSGSVDDAAFLEEMPCRIHERVLWLGYRSDVSRVMRALDLLVVPSRQEGMGRVVAEAMAASKPVVGARAGGIPEVIVDGETGFLFDGDDEEALLRRLRDLIADPALRRRMGEAGRKRAMAQFDRDRQTDKILNLVVETCQR